MKSYRAIVGEGVGIEENFGSAAERIHAIDHALILEAIILVIIVFPILSFRRETGLGVIVEMSEAFAYLLTERNLREIVFSHLVFSLHPFERGRSGVVFKRTVRIGHDCAEILI